MPQQLHIAIIGATSFIAEHCARLWAQAPAVKFTLVARNADKLAAITADLHVRNPNAAINPFITDFFNPNAIQALVSKIVANSPIDIVLIAHGALPDQARCQTDLDVCAQTLAINAVSPLLFAEAFAQHLEQRQCGTLAIIGSVAGDRGRKSNYIYGASKGLLTRYVQGLQHRFTGTPVKVVLINPGPTDTPMTYAFKQQGVRLASPELVAQQIVTAIAKGKRVVYTPGRWRWIMMLLCGLPAFIFNQLDI
jgi:short-subunit dehydrogenase